MKCVLTASSKMKGDSETVGGGWFVPLLQGRNWLDGSTLIFVVVVVMRREMCRIVRREKADLAQAVLPNDKVRRKEKKKKENQWGESC